MNIHFLQICGSDLPIRTGQLCGEPGGSQRCFCQNPRHSRRFGFANPDRATLWWTGRLPKMLLPKPPPFTAVRICQSGPGNSVVNRAALWCLRGLSNHLTGRKRSAKLTVWQCAKILFQQSGQKIGFIKKMAFNFFCLHTIFSCAVWYRWKQNGNTTHLCVAGRERLW